MVGRKGTSSCGWAWSCPRSSSAGNVRSSRPSPKSATKTSERISSRRWEREPKETSCLHDRDSLRADRGAPANAEDVRTEGPAPSAQKHREHQALFAG